MPSKGSQPPVTVYNNDHRGEWAFDSSLRGKVVLSGVSASVTLPVSGSIGISSANATPAMTVISRVTAGTKSTTVVASHTATKVVGFSIYNEGANARRFQLRFGGTAFWYGGLASGAAFNWNFINQQQAAANKAVKIYINGAGTAVVTVYWRAT
jgi:hypothetical protein